MHSRPTSHEFYLSLMELILAVKQQITAIGSEFDLTSIQATTIFLLDARNPRPMKSFCTLYHCDASNITGIVDGLERKGLVSRQSDPNDRRIKTIQLEPSGRTLQQKIHERLSNGETSLFDPLSDTEARQFTSLIRKITAAAAPELGAVPSSISYDR